MALSEKDKYFADLYIAHKFNAVSAYREYSPDCTNDRSAAACASRLLKKPGMQEYIHERAEERKNETGLIASVDDVLKFYSDVMNGTATRKKVVVVNDELVEQDVHPTFAESLRGADGLAKAYGLEKKELQVDVGYETMKAFADMTMKERLDILRATMKEIGE